MEDYLTNKAKVNHTHTAATYNNNHHHDGNPKRTFFRNNGIVGDAFMNLWILIYKITHAT